VYSRESLFDEFMVKILCTGRVTDNDRLYILLSYINALKAVNADVYVCSYGINTDDAASVFDGLLVTGGGDVNPDLYHAAWDPTTHAEPDCIDSMDISLVHSFIKASKPIFGICRGIQVINVALGGTLIQDLNTCGKPKRVTKTDKKNTSVTSRQNSKNLFLSDAEFRLWEDDRCLIFRKLFE
jgi:gamma-glutamyl-gamma-aminobutyrate hydrolase PuuD